MLNLDLSTLNPVQSDSQFANVPLPSAHLVVIEESEIKDSTDQATGFNKGQNLVLHLTILASSHGNENVGEKLALYCPLHGKEEAVKAGMKRLSTLAYTLGLGGYLQDKEQLHGQSFIVVLDKNKDNNFPNFKRILNAQGQEIADVSGNFKACTLKENALIVELEKLLANQNGGGVAQQAPQNNALVGNTGFAQPQAPVQQQQAQQPFQQANTQPQQSFVPNQNFGQAQATDNAGVPPFAQAQQQTTQQAPQGFGGQGGGNWGNTVNQQNGQ